MCFCDLPCDVGDHSDCPIELRACPKHENGISPAELEAVKEAGAVEIQFPAKLPEALKEIASDSKNYVGFCLWCGHGYERYTREVVAEHFAYNCPDAPQGLKKHMKRVLTTRVTKRCRKSTKSLK